ncbi:MAG TPA: hypothetical protein VLA19_08035 [Herpetosiphonaceae bacterium]|nr:hypothetical protein [Herpetosiphonaceae bacterium]
MSGNNELREFHQRVTRMIIDERTHEMEEVQARQRQAEQASQARVQRGQQILADVGIDLSEVEAANRARERESNQAFETVLARLEQESRERQPDEFSVQQALAPASTFALSPSWVAGFSSQDDKITLARAADIRPQDLLTGGSCQDYWNRADGGGWGCLGSGVGEIQSWVYFGFWFKPTVNRFWSIVPLFRFRGFYIAQADDGFWDCKNAHVRASAWTNVYQYDRWLGWNHVDVYDVSGDNISTNNRFDTDRTTYNSYLLGADWAFISAAIGLYARAQGGGAHAVNDFSTGDANYLCVPQCWVY